MVSLQSIDHLGFSSKQFQSCNKSLINQDCSGPSSENIGPRSFLFKFYSDQGTEGLSVTSKEHGHYRICYITFGEIFLAGYSG